MAYKLTYPYIGNQALIISDRVHLHARKDAILILGKNAVGISSTNKVAIESGNLVVLESNKIELGKDAIHPLIYGDKMNSDMDNFLSSVRDCGDSLTKVSESDLANMASVLVSIGNILKNSSEKFRSQLSGSLSNTAFVK